MGVAAQKVNQNLPNLGYKNNEFCDPRSTLNLFDAHDSYQTQATTRLVSIDGHRAYLHLYYTDYYKNHQVEALMSTLKSLEKKLSLEEKIKDPALEVRNTMAVGR